MYHNKQLNIIKTGLRLYYLYGQSLYNIIYTLQTGEDRKRCNQKGICHNPNTKKAALKPNH